MNNLQRLQSSDYKQYFENAISYESYKDKFQREIENGAQSPYAQYLPQNWSRQSRLDRKLNLNEDLLEKISEIKKPLNWLVITEHWCGDASQINPIINKAAFASNKLITLKFIYRDENERLIDAHLTDGASRSIPMLLQFDTSFNLLGTYGPRPRAAQQLVKSLLSKGEAYSIPLHSWYAKDKQKAVQEDLNELIGNHSS